MMISPHPAGLRVVTQNDHAHFAAELLSLWRQDGLPTHPRRDELLRATREHDNGWREADSAPRVDRDNGRPHDFITTPRDVRAEIWRRGTRRHQEDAPYVALLVTLHALYLHRDRAHDPVYGALLAELTELRDELLDATGVGLEAAAGDYAFLDLADLLSLVVCTGSLEPFERRGVRGHFDGTALQLDPFPLAGGTSFRIACRTIPDRRYTGDGDLAIELARARWQETTVRVRPFGG
jgi:hypothetical protein